MSKIHSFITSVKHRAQQFTLTTPAAIIVAALILGSSHVVYGLVATGSGKPAANIFAGKPIDASDYVEGDSKSDVLVVEYSDPECPYCISVYPTMKQLRNDYKDTVGFVYRHFPLTQIHPHAYDESKAIICAATLGGSKAYFEYIDALYGYKSAQQTTQLPSSGKEDMAANLGLDRAAFSECLTNQNTSTAVDASINDGVQAGVQGTPTSFVLVKTRKGYEIVATVDGARPYEYFKAAIDEALSR
jgi:protein-disulfide isomerase